MIDHLPLYITLLFIFATLFAVYQFYVAIPGSKRIITILIIWLILQGIVALTGFYTVSNSFPPRFMLLPLPALLVIVAAFLTKSGRRFIDSLDLKTLTYLHIVRILVEVVLVLLCANKLVPRVMTYEGRNFDIISGLTAPLVAYYGFTKPILSKKIILVWNIICLLLLFNVVSIAILSAPFPFQTLAFDQPNVAVLYFPFVWLPCCIVPLVLFSHLTAIRRLIKS
jgi:hypothetical protein